MLKIYNDGTRITAALSGDIDHHTAREFRTALDDVIARSRPEVLIIDMEKVGFMDSSGIGLILGRIRSARGRRRTADKKRPPRDRRGDKDLGS